MQGAHGVLIRDHIGIVVRNTHSETPWDSGPTGGGHCFDFRLRPKEESQRTLRFRV